MAASLLLVGLAEVLSGLAEGGAVGRETGVGDRPDGSTCIASGWLGGNSFGIFRLDGVVAGVGMTGVTDEVERAKLAAGAGADCV